MQSTSIMHGYCGCMQISAGELHTHLHASIVNLSVAAVHARCT